MPRPFGLPPRLRDRQSFLRVQQTARRRAGRYVVVLAAASETGPRVGYTVSRKVGGAVVRNRVRRRLREIVRLHQHLLGQSCELVIIAYAGAKAAPFMALQGDVVRLLGRTRCADGSTRP